MRASSLIARRVSPLRFFFFRFLRHSLILFFLLFCGYLLWDSLTPQLPSPKKPILFYSNQAQQDLTLTFLEAMRKAKSSIDLAIFGLTDGSILKELKRQAKKGIDVKIYYDAKGSPPLKEVIPNCKLFAIQQSALMHQKILVIDEEKLFLGSANMTSQSLQMHDNLVIGLHSPKMASFLKEKIARHPGHLQTLVGSQEIDLWLLPDPKGEALLALKKKIRQAEKTIHAALFTFTHPMLIEELILAHKRGVEVILVIDLHSSLGASAKAIGELMRAGIFILVNRGTKLLHHKFVYIDETCLITGSANWTKAAFLKNNDALFMIHHLTQEQKKFLHTLWNRLALSAKPLSN